MRVSPHCVSGRVSSTQNTRPTPTLKLQSACVECRLPAVLGRNHLAAERPNRMNVDPIRVFQVATGNVGTEMIKRLGNHPDLELIGLHCYTPEKIGRDVGE